MSLTDNEKHELAAQEQGNRDGEAGQQRYLTDQEQTTVSSRKQRTSKPKTKAKAPTATDSEAVYLLINFETCCFTSLREEELPKHAHTILGNENVKLVKGSFLTPEISFKPAS